MNLMLWILAGIALGWAARTYFDLNGGRGVVLSAIIGAAGAYLGGHFLAPALGAGSEQNSGLSIFALIVAIATAVAALKAADMVYERFEV